VVEDQPVPESEEFAVVIPETLEEGVEAGSGRGDSTEVPGAAVVELQTDTDTDTEDDGSPDPVTPPDTGDSDGPSAAVDDGSDVGNEQDLVDNTSDNASDDVLAGDPLTGETGGDTISQDVEPSADLAPSVSMSDDPPVNASLVESAIVDFTAAQNAERTSITDRSSVRARALDGVLTLDTVQSVIQSRDDLILDITAEVSVGAMSTADSRDAGTIELNCTLPENIELEECRIDVGTQSQ